MEIRVCAQDAIPTAIVGIESTLPDGTAPGSNTAGETLCELLSAELSRGESRIQLLDRAHIVSVMAEQKLQLSGAIDTEKNAKFAALLGAKVLIIGRLYNVGDERWLSAKIVHVQTGRSETALVKKPASTTLSELATALAAQITRKLDAAIPAVSDSPKGIVAQINELLGKRKRPSIEIAIEPSKSLDADLLRTLRLEATYLFKGCRFPVEVNVSDKSDASPAKRLKVSIVCESQTTARIESRITCSATLTMNCTGAHAFNAVRNGTDSTERSATRAAMLASLNAAALELLPTLAEP